MTVIPQFKVKGNVTENISDFSRERHQKSPETSSHRHAILAAPRGFVLPGESPAFSMRDKSMSKKSGAIAELIEQFKGRDLDAHYFGYFECFNRRLYFEAHDVLEELWLADRSGPNYSFYKGLIQLAGAFVHLQKNRLRPAAALFKLADTNLEKYPPLHERLRVDAVRVLISQWQRQLEAGNFEKNPLTAGTEPELRLEP